MTVHVSSRSVTSCTDISPPSGRPTSGQTDWLTSLAIPRAVLLAWLKQLFGFMGSYVQVRCSDKPGLDTAQKCMDRMDRSYHRETVASICCTKIS